MSENIYRTEARALRRMRFFRNYERFDVLHRLTVSELSEDIAELNRPFESVLLYGFHPGTGATPDFVKKLYANGAKTVQFGELIRPPFAQDTRFLIYDENDEYSFENRYDLVVSLYTLQTVTHLPRALAQYRAALNPDGVLMTALFDPACLAPLRAALQKAELAETSGATRRFHPAIDIKDFGSLLTKVKFSAPVVSMQTRSFRYKSPFDLIRDIRGIGENAALIPAPQSFSKNIYRQIETFFYREPSIIPDREGYFEFMISSLNAIAYAK